jgi:hypothetical protein
MRDSIHSRVRHKLPTAVHRRREPDVSHRSGAPFQQCLRLLAESDRAAHLNHIIGFQPYVGDEVAGRNLPGIRRGQFDAGTGELGPHPLDSIGAKPSRHISVLRGLSVRSKILGIKTIQHAVMSGVACHFVLSGEVLVPRS